MILSILAAAIGLCVPQDSEALIRALASDDPEERATAAAALEKRGLAAMEPLRAAAAGGDVEVAARARDLLLRIRATRLGALKLERQVPFQPGFGRADHFRVTPDGAFAAGHDLERVRVWTVPEGRVVREWTAHANGARDLVLSPDGKRLLTWSFDGLALWDMPAAALVRRYDSLRLLPRSIATTADGTLTIWARSDAVDGVDTATGRTLWSAERDGTLRTPVAVALSPAGDRVASVCANNPQAEVRDSRTGTVLRSIQVPTTGFRSRVAFTRDGASVVVSNPDHQKAWRFSATSGIKEAEGVEAEFDLMAGGTARVKVVTGRNEKADAGWVVVQPPKEPYVDSPELWALTKDQRQVLVRTLNGRQVLVFDAGTGELVRRIGADASKFAVGVPGVLIGTRGGELALLDLEGKELRRVAGGQGIVSRVAFAGAGRALWIDGANVLRCSELEGGKELWRKDYLTLGWCAHALMPDGLHAVGDVEDGRGGRRQLVRWDLAGGRAVTTYASFEGYLAGVAASPDGARVAASTRDGPLAVWEAATGKKLWEVRPGKNARWLRFSSDGASLFAADDAGRVARHAAAGGEVERLYQENGIAVEEGALSADGKRLALVSRGAGVTVHDVETGASLRAWKEAGTGGAAFLEGSAKLISGSPVAVADVSTGAVLARFDLPSPLRSAGLDPSRSFAGLLFQGGRFEVVDLESGRSIWRAKDPTATGFALGPGAESVVFFDERDQARSFRRGEAGPAATLDRTTVAGFDASRGRLFTADGLARDFVSFEPKEAGPAPGVRSIRGFAGALFARVDEKLVRLSTPDQPLLGVVCPIEAGSAWDVDPTGGLVMIDGELRDVGGRVRGRLDPEAVRGARAVFFGASGERLVAVTADGTILILAPRD